MATTRFRDGPVTVTLDGGLEELVRKALDAAGGEAVRIMEDAAEQIASRARAEWYAPGTGVRRRTGRSGQIEVITTVSADEVRVSVGSTDIERAVKIHRPGRLSTVAEEITANEYYAAKRAGGAAAARVFQARRARPDQGVEAGKFYRSVHNPLSSDGKYLLPELVTKPMRLKVKAITPELGQAIAARLRRA